MTDLADRAAAVRGQYNECFGCGLDNPIGLHLDGFTAVDDELRARFSPRQDYRGFDGILHGGVLAALLDETLAWTAMMLEGTYVVTASLQLKFRKPAPTDAAYDVVGRIEQRRGKRLKLAGGAAAGGEIVAEASGLFLATRPV